MCKCGILREITNQCRVCALREVATFEYMKSNNMVISSFIRKYDLPIVPNDIFELISNYIQMDVTCNKYDFKWNIGLLRWFHASCVINNKLIIQGGKCNRYRYKKVSYDTFYIDLDELVNNENIVYNEIGFYQSIGKSHHTLIGLNDNTMFIFAGFDENNVINNDCFVITQLFLNSSKSWMVKPIIFKNRFLNIPEERRCHCCFIINGNIIIFGGCKGNIYFNDMYYISINQILLMFNITNHS